MFDFSVEAIIFIVYSLAILIVLYAIRTARTKRILWSVLVAIIPFLATLVMWKWGFPVFMMVVGFGLFTVVSIINIVFVRFCDECGKLVTVTSGVRNKELFCFDCKKAREMRMEQTRDK